jgi:hypothetical protein
MVRRLPGGGRRIRTIGPAKAVAKAAMAALVEPDETAVARHISGKDRGETAHLI